MALTLSIKKTWFGLILLVSILPMLVMQLWGSYKYYNLQLEHALQREEFYRELSLDHINQAIMRLVTLLENKGDPIAHNLAHKQNQQTLDELLAKVIERESSVHGLLILNTDGSIITGIEDHDPNLGLSPTRPSLLAHWQPSNSTNKFIKSLNNGYHISPIEIHPEGIFFRLAVPIGSPKQPLAILVAYIDASSLWAGLKDHLTEYGLTAYLINHQGILLSSVSGSRYKIGQSLDHLLPVQAFIAGNTLLSEKAYRGIMGEPVFGSMSILTDMNASMITEVEQHHLISPIRITLIRIILVAIIVTLFLAWLGLSLTNRLVKPLTAISTDFKRVAKQNYTPCSISSHFIELQSLVDSFNGMVSEIDKSQRKLRQAAAVFSSSLDGIIITNATGKIIAINHALTTITGYSEQEVLGRTPSIFKSDRHNQTFYDDMWQSIKELGQWRGEVWHQRKNGERFPTLLTIKAVNDDGDEISHHVSIITDISTIKETEEKLSQLAHHDPLTKLPNRLLLNSRLEHALQHAERKKTQVGILFLDLDRFKNINDSMGHTQGDHLLKSVASRLANAMRAEDTIARLGGDEFVILVEELEDMQGIIKVAKNTLSIFKKPFHIYNQDIFIEASIGISIYPNDGKNTDILLRNADTAMYQAKEKGRNNYQFYTKSLTDKARERLTIETNLRRALERNEFELYYQPQFSLKDSAIIGVEALIRWNHPEQGLVSPVSFIPVAEETGLIVPIGKWVMRTACMQHQAWLKEGHPPIKIAVNLSARQFHESGITSMISDILEETTMDSTCLELELTESIVMNDVESTIKILNELHWMGLEISIDDFGTGYSSLSYLKRFPIDRLKIDQSFIRDISTSISDAELVTAIITLARSMKLKVIAEGVETKEQLHYLKKQECDEVQGYYYSKPLPAKELIQFLHKNKISIS